MKAKYLPYFIIVGLLAYIFILQECKKPVKPLQIVTVKDSLVKGKDTTIYYPVPTPYEIRDTFYKEIDTAAILESAIETYKEFNVLKKYDLLLFDDSVGKISLLADVQYNQIQKYSTVGHRNELWRTKDVGSVVDTKQHNKLFIGAYFTSNLNNLGISATGTLLTKRDHLYQIGYDPINKIGGVGIGVKIRLRKK